MESLNYKIFYSPTENAPANNFSQGRRVGIEIQPPLSPEAAAGLMEELRAQEPGFGHVEAIARSVNLTRNDEAGTAFAIAPNLSRAENSLGVARLISRLINP